ncbi:Hypothetical protein NTJ_15503 [Nesidiocoris tenuis]|uniref:Transmembrane protein n=1 Tax=Nesidiocoris tenuis TaxID=355587 RepID=A0ABN7BHV1_9HEMI|nr:Hypothetical protein NTJ_15503 [Nesidiocoris tenuis]
MAADQLACDRDFERSNDDRTRTCTSSPFHGSQATSSSTAHEEDQLISNPPRLLIRRECRGEKEKLIAFYWVSFLTIVYAAAYFTYLIVLS